MFPLKVRVLNKLAYPVQNQTLFARIVSWTPSSPDYDFCNYALENNGTLEGIRFAEICTFELQGHQVVSDTDGIATFVDLRFSRGVPSMVILEVFVEDCREYLQGTCTAPIFRNVSLGIQLLAGPAILKSLNSAPTSLHTDTPLSHGSHPPLAKLTDSYGIPRAAVPIVAFSVSNASQFGARVRGEMLLGPANFVVFGTHPSRSGDSNKISILSGAVVLTDSNGIADFSSMRVVASNSRSQVIGFYALGMFDLWNLVDQTPEGKLMVHEFTLVEPEEDPVSGKFNSKFNSLRAVPRRATLDDTAWETRGISFEGQVMDDVSVQVGVPSDGPLSLNIIARPGKRVIAEAIPHYAPSQEREVVALVGEELGRAAMMATRRWRTFKTLINAVSEPADGRGIARFTDMRFSREGVAGVYRLRMFVNGIEDPQEFIWEVKSSIAKVLVTTPAEVQKLEGLHSEYGCISEGPKGCGAMGLVPLPGLCKAQDDTIAAMKALSEIPLAQQSDLDRAIGALGTSLETDRQLPCRDAVALTEQAAGSFLIQILDGRGIPLVCAFSSSVPGRYVGSRIAMHTDLVSNSDA